MGRTACTEPQCLYKGALFLLRCVISFYFSETSAKLGAAVGSVRMCMKCLHEVIQAEVFIVHSHVKRLGDPQQQQQQQQHMHSVCLQQLPALTTATPNLFTTRTLL
jgi:GTP-sensing pleiotropic transcriptional regulator CodY